MSIKSRPRIIYLDTSDFARLYTAGPSTLEERIKHQIVDILRSRTDVVLIYSWVHVWEFIQGYSSTHSKDRLLRAQFIKTICGRNCLRFPLRWKLGSYSNDGDWMMNEIDFTIQRLLNIVLDYMCFRTGVRISRKERRSLKSKGARRRLALSRPELINIAPYESELPISSKFLEDDILRKYMYGNISQEEADHRAQDIFRDIEEFYRKVLLYGKKEGLMKEIFLKMGAALEECVDRVRSQRPEAEQLLEKIVQFENAWKAAGQPRPDLRQTKENKKKVIDLLSGRNLPLPPGEDIDIFTQKLLRSYVAHQNNNTGRIKTSDSGDLFHAQYIQHVDLWRGDRAFSNILISQKVDGYEKICPTLENLMNRIQEI